MRSDILIEGYNAKLGNSTVEVTWRDMNTGQSVTKNFKLEILPVGEYNRRVAAGLITIKTLNSDVLKIGEDEEFDSES